jgi:hypothetical protein
LCRDARTTGIERGRLAARDSVDIDFDDISLADI